MTNFTRTKSLPTIIANDGNINIIAKSRSNADANGKVGGGGAAVIGVNLQICCLILSSK
jgi:hypothetical protein